ncbi:MAG: hypothetical protein IPL86_15560 [Flavobacteriales bacterium]|nr:hypothetical protein [Flavobacteriales bacterium]
MLKRLAVGLAVKPFTKVMRALAMSGVSLTTDTPGLARTPASAVVDVRIMS